MSIVTSWGAPVIPVGATTRAQQRQAARDWWAPRVATLGCSAPDCPLEGAGRLTVHQVRDRAAWTTDPVDDPRVWIAQAVCQACRAFHTLLPGCLLPFGGTASR
jgi:hypothetical protein